MDMFLKVFWNFIVLALRNMSTRVALRVGAESTGRDNDPGGLGGYAGFTRSHFSSELKLGQFRDTHI